MSSVPIQQAGPLLSTVLAYCIEHPYAGDDLEVGVLTFQQQMVGDERGAAAPASLFALLYEPL